jgi:hypothetical protein
LVPTEGRKRWLAEWTGELTFVNRHRGYLFGFIFACGAFQDAVWFRWDYVREGASQNRACLRKTLDFAKLLLLLAITCACSRCEIAFNQAPLRELYDVYVDASFPNVALQFAMAIATVPVLASLNPKQFRRHSPSRSNRTNKLYWILLGLQAFIVMAISHFLGLFVAHLAESGSILLNSVGIYQAIRGGILPVEFLVTYASCVGALGFLLQSLRSQIEPV